MSSKISDLTAATTSSLNDLIPIVQSGTNKKASLSLLNFLVASSGSGFLVAPFAESPSQTRTTLTAVGVAAGAYCLGNWWLETNASNNEYQTRTYNIGDSTPPVEYKSGGPGYYGVVKNTNAGTKGFTISQVVESKFSGALRGQSLTFKISGQLSTGTGTLKIAVFEWTGTADSTNSKKMVASWTGNVPTFNSTTFTQLGSTATTELTASGWSEASVTVTAGASGNNYTVVAWIEGVPTGVSVYLTAPWFSLSSIAPGVWTERLNESELLKRYYETTYNFGVGPGTATSAGILQQGEILSPGSYAQVVRGTFQFKVEKRIAPTVTFYDSAGTAGCCNFGNESAGRTATEVATGMKSTACEGSGATVADSRMYFHCVVDARI